MLRTRTSGVANSIIGGGGAHIHIFEFADHENNRFQSSLLNETRNEIDVHYGRNKDCWQNGKFYPHI